MVCCVECRYEYPDHPESVLMAQEAAAEKAKARPPAVTHKIDYASSYPERILAMEKALAAQGARLDRLEVAVQRKK